MRWSTVASSNATQTVTIGIDLGEITGPQTYSVYRKDIDRGGAPGIFDGYGSATVSVNGRSLLLIHLREDADGHATLEVSGLSPKSVPKVIAAIDLEANDIVPARAAKERTS